MPRFSSRPSVREARCEENDVSGDVSRSPKNCIASQGEKMDSNQVIAQIADLTERTSALRRYL